MSIIEAIGLFAVMVGMAALPSSSVALVIARSSMLGISNGIAVSLGIVVGDLLFILLAILGLSVAAELIGGFFGVLKIAGGVYLIWFGFTLLKAKRGNILVETATFNRKSLMVSFSAGFLLTLGDVKAIIFYASLFPLFINLETAGVIDYMLIVVITIMSVGSVKVIYALSASRLAKIAMGKSVSDLPQKIAGSLMVGVGSYVVFKA